ncbi:MAG: PQQ-like beta-propeller repeat protein [Actinobacteria bacterium]|nr:PQQ-like beta-propeller repeat protein [Actinomycetota bacterium]
MLGRAALRRTGCLAIVAIVVIGLAGCDWPLDRFDAGRTANNPLSGLSTSNVSHLGIAWSAATGGGALIVNGLVLTARADTPGHTGTEALSVSDGSVRWTSDVSVEAVDGGVGYGVRNDLTPGYVLFAVALDTGQTLWSGASQLNTGSVVSAGDGRVYVQTTNGSGHGTMPEMDVWNTSTHQLAWTKLNPLYPLLPAIANGIVYFAENVGEVLDAVDETTGAQRWSTTQQPSCPALTTSPVVSDGYLFWGARPTKPTTAPWSHSGRGSSVPRSITRRSRSREPRSTPRDPPPARTRRTSSPSTGSPAPCTGRMTEFAQPGTRVSASSRLRSSPTMSCS